jgi:hypothetical protein
MKIEVFLYGMFNGKIRLLKTGGVNTLLSAQNFFKLRNLKPEDSGKYLWLPTEQVIAYPYVVKVSDGDGREWVKNQTLLMTIHDYLHYTNANELMASFLISMPDEFPKCLEPINLDKHTLLKPVTTN